MAEPDGTAELPSAGSGFDLADARECVGAKLEEVGGGNVGRVHGVLVDAVDGSPTWLVVKLGRIGRRAAVPAAAATQRPPAAPGPPSREHGSAARRRSSPPTG